ncbi:hypothetical protein [Cohnella boryungensis]|uniref:HTH domain-containing protein n=1 Tax=Cohnella boryungensis TaxID=768479 RepID=A0ABV8SFU7_9BACL
MPQTSYPFPMYSGLLEPGHYKNIGSAIWLFLWCVSATTTEKEKDGIVWGIVLGNKPVKTEELAARFEVSDRTIRDWLKVLKDHEYIRVTRAPSGLILTVRKSKKFLHRPEENFRSDRQNSSDHSPGNGGDRKKSSDHFAERPEENFRSNKDIIAFKDLAVVVVEDDDPSKSDDEGMLLPRHGAAPAAAADPDADSGQSGVSFTDYRRIITDKFISRRAKGTFLSPKDESALDEIVACKIPLDTVLRGIDKAYDEYKPKHYRDAVRTLDFCVPIILDLHVSEQRKRETSITKTPRKSKQQLELEDLRRKREEARQRDQR